jgi:hypothetical protein
MSRLAEIKARAEQVHWTLTSIANGIIRLPPVLEMESFLKARGGVEWLAAAR